MKKLILTLFILFIIPSSLAQVTFQTNPDLVGSDVIGFFQDDYRLNFYKSDCETFLYYEDSHQNIDGNDYYFSWYDLAPLDDTYCFKINPAFKYSEFDFTFLQFNVNFSFFTSDFSYHNFTSLSYTTHNFTNFSTHKDYDGYLIWSMNYPFDNISFDSNLFAPNFFSDKSSGSFFYKYHSPVDGYHYIQYTLDDYIIDIQESTAINNKTNTIQISLSDVWLDGIPELYYNPSLMTDFYNFETGKFELQGNTIFTIYHQNDFPNGTLRYSGIPVYRPIADELHPTIGTSVLGTSYGDTIVVRNSGDLVVQHIYNGEVIEERTFQFSGVDYKTKPVGIQFLRDIFPKDHIAKWLIMLMIFTITIAMLYEPAREHTPVKWLLIGLLCIEFAIFSLLGYIPIIWFIVGLVIGTALLVGWIRKLLIGDG